MEPPIPSPKKSEDEDDDVAPLNFWDETAGVVDQACAEAIVATGLIDYEPKRKPMINRLLPFEAFTEDGLFIVQRSATDKHWKPV